MNEVFYVNQYEDGKLTMQYDFVENETVEEIDEFLDFCKKMDQHYEDENVTYKLTSIKEEKFHV